MLRSSRIPVLLNHSQCKEELPGFRKAGVNHMNFFQQILPMLKTLQRAVGIVMFYFLYQLTLYILKNI